VSNLISEKKIAKNRKKSPKIDQIHCDFFPNEKIDLRWGWVFLERTRILSGIQFTAYFIEIFVVETKRFVSRKIISYRSAFAFRSSARALAAGLPRQGHVYKTTDESFRFHNKNFDEIRC